MYYILGYWLILFIYAIVMWRKKRSESSFLVNERTSGTFSVAMSLTALVFGASSVFGLAGYAYLYNLNAIWWTLSGIVFLIILRFAFISRLVDLKGYTISDIVSAAFGPGFKIVISGLILASWIMVLAAQIIAGGNMINMLIGSRELSYVVFCLIFFSYTFITGQSGTVRTSWIQNLIMLAGTAVLLVYVLLAYNTIPEKSLQFNFGFNDKFTPGFFLNIFIPVGLAYLFGPDIYSRIFTARNAKSAGRGILAACLCIAVISAMIVLIGIYGGQVLGNVAVPDRIIPELATHEFSGFMKSIILIALISIPLSGADAMLANMATYLGRDVAGGVYSAATGRSAEKFTVLLIRLSMIIIVIVAILTALNAKEIIPTLLIAYKVFSTVIVPFLMVSMLSLKYNIKWKNSTMNAILGVYAVLSVVFVIAVELKIMTVSIQYLNLYLTVFNMAVFAVLFLIMKRKYKVAE